MSALDDIKDELITVLQGDSTFTNDGFYRSMFEVTSNTPKPCHSLDLDRDTPGEDEYSGGMVRNYTVEAVLISYIEPETLKTSIGDILDSYRQSAKDAFQDKEDTGTWTNIKNYRYLESYPMPWTETYQGSPRLVAHRMITKFMIDYEVR